MKNLSFESQIKILFYTLIKVINERIIKMENLLEKIPTYKIQLANEIVSFWYNISQEQWFHIGFSFNLTVASARKTNGKRPFEFELTFKLRG